MKLAVNDKISWKNEDRRESGVIQSLHLVKNGLGEKCVAAVVTLAGTFKAHAHKLILIQESAKIRIEHQTND